MKISLDSEHLKRSVTLEIFIPPGANGPLPFIILFDGQDNDRMKLDKIYEKFLTEKNNHFYLLPYMPAIKDCMNMVYATSPIICIEALRRN